MEAEGFYSSTDFPVQFSMNELGDFLRIVLGSPNEIEAVRIIAERIEPVNDSDLNSRYIAEQIYSDCIELAEGAELSASRVMVTA